MKKELQAAMKNAMKEKNKLALSTIRGVLSAVQYEEMRKGKDELSADEVISVIRSELKKRNESMEYAEKDGRVELIDELKKEIAILSSFLPQQMTAEELEAVVNTIKNENPSANMGDIMKKLREGYQGKFDGKLASEIVKKCLA